MLFIVVPSKIEWNSQCYLIKNYYSQTVDFLWCAFSMGVHWGIFVSLFKYLCIFCTKGSFYINYKKYRCFTNEISPMENYQISTLWFFILYFKEIKNAISFIPKVWFLFPTKINRISKRKWTPYSLLLLKVYSKIKYSISSTVSSPLCKWIYLIDAFY